MWPLHQAELAQAEETLGVQGKWTCVQTEEEDVAEEEGREKNRWRNFKRRGDSHSQAPSEQIKS